jgi:hypothetical protein
MPAASNPVPALWRLNAANALKKRTVAVPTMRFSARQSNDGDGAAPFAQKSCVKRVHTTSQPVEDANGSVDYKANIVRVLVERCFRDAVAASL